jgi:glycerol-3-phosphate acyltransferase PlsX
VLVGNPDVAARLLHGRPGADLVESVGADETIRMDEDPVRAVRAKRTSSVRVAASLVRSGEADGFVSAGSTGATVAAALFTLGRVPGMVRAGLAVVVPAASAPVVLLDAGASPDAGVDVLWQLALAGSAYAQIRLGVATPRVGLLSIGAEAGKGDELRKQAYDALSRLAGITFVGNVEGGDVAAGGRADVVVTDGFTGNVLLKGMEGAVAMATAALASAIGSDPALQEAAALLRPAFDQAADSIDPEQQGGALLLGVNGVVVVAHGATTPRALAASIAVAADAVRSDVVARVTATMDQSVANRTSAGYAARVGERA